MKIVAQELEPALDDIFCDFKSHVQFYATPRHFEKIEVSNEAREHLKSMSWKAFKMFYLYFTQKRAANSNIARKEKLIKM